MSRHGVSCVGSRMRLPSHLLAKLTLAGLTLGAACEQAHEPQCKSAPVVETDSTPLAEVVRMTNEPRPAATPIIKPQPQPTKPVPPPPVIKKPSRKVLASVCGHTQLVDEKSSLVRCGKG